METIKAFGGKFVNRAPKGGFDHPVTGKPYRGGQFCPLYAVAGGSDESAPTLVLRAVGNGWYQHLEVDLAAARVVAAWPATERSEPTPRTSGPAVRPSELKGDAGKAYRAAFKAWDGRAFNFDRPTPPVVPAGSRLVLGQASHVGNYARPWVARISGSHATYRFDRQFVSAHETERGRNWTWYLTDGLYEICNRNSKGNGTRSFVRVVAGERSYVDPAEVEAAFPPIAAPEGVAATFCPVCGRRGPLVHDLEDEIDKCYSCCDIPEYVQGGTGMAEDY